MGVRTVLKIQLAFEGINLMFVIFYLFFFSEGRPSRSDLSILVAHNDDPTGNSFEENRSMCIVTSNPQDNRSRLSILYLNRTHHKS